MFSQKLAGVGDTWESGLSTVGYTEECGLTGVGYNSKFRLPGVAYFGESLVQFVQPSRLSNDPKETVH